MTARDGNQEAARLAAEQVDHRANQIQQGEVDDPTGDLLDRCTHYYANAFGITVDEINAARRA